MSNKACVFELAWNKGGLARRKTLGPGRVGCTDEVLKPGANQLERQLRMWRVCCRLLLKPKERKMAYLTWTQEKNKLT